MPKMLFALSFSVLVAIGVTAKDATPTRGYYIDLTSDFSRFFDASADLEERARVSAFRRRMDPLLPGFYAPGSGTTPEQYEARVADALRNFAALRPKYAEVQRTFPVAFAAGIRHFRKQFPGFTPNVPVYLLHSLGEMDGGTRDIDGKTYLLFGADVIAQIHRPDDLTPFLDHELFHVENHKAFPECEEVWCSLWAEGLATYAAEVMNHGASDEQLLLTLPKPIRAEVDAHWAAALCFTRARLFSRDEADLRAMFMYSTRAQEFPSRFGYYVGLRIAEQLGREYKLPQLAHLPPERVKALLPATLDRMIRSAGGCGATS
jgi:hypothetical protein